MPVDTKRARQTACTRAHGRQQSGPGQRGVPKQLFFKESWSLSEKIFLFKKATAA